MANKYVDLELGVDTNNGNTWATAMKTVNNMLQDATNKAVAGDKVWVRRTNVGTPAAELPAADTTFGGTTVIGTVDNPVWVIGVKDGTNTDPPVEADITKQSAGDTQPETLGTSGNNNFFAFSKTTHMIVVGINMGSRGDATTIRGHIQLIECEIQSDQELSFKEYAATDDAFHTVDRCKISSANTGFNIFFAPFNELCEVEFIDCVLNYTGAAPSGPLFELNQCVVRCIGCDFSSFGSGETLVGWANEERSKIYFTDCKLWPSMTFSSGTPDFAESSVIEVTRGVDGTKTSGQSFIQYHRETRAGVCRASTAILRTGGASDAASGAFTLELEPAVNETLENAIGVRSSFLVGWVAGDGTTTKTVTIFFNNDSGADLVEGDVKVTLFSPPGDGDAQAKMSLNFSDILPTATALTDDTASTWTGLTANGNPQKAVFTLSGVNAPDYEGPIYAQVEFQKRYASAVKKLYVDPKLSIA